MQIIDKIVDRMWDYIVARPLERSLQYMDKHRGEKQNLKVQSNCDKLASMGLGMDTYIGLQAKAQAKAESIIGNMSNSKLFKFYFTFFFHFYRILVWLKRPFFLFEIF